jgi:hypothetical protein
MGNIVKHLLPIQLRMYANKNYVKENGTIQSSDDFSRHKYVLDTVKKSIYTFLLVK